MEDWNKKAIPTEGKILFSRFSRKRNIVFFYGICLFVAYLYRYEMEGMIDYYKTAAIVIALFVKNYYFPTKDTATRWFYLFHLTIAIIFNIIAIQFAYYLCSWAAHLSIIVLFFWTIRITYFAFFTYIYKKFDIGARLLLCLLIFFLLIVVLKYNFVYY